LDITTGDDLLGIFDQMSSYKHVFDLNAYRCV